MFEKQETVLKENKRVILQKIETPMETYYWVQTKPSNFNKVTRFLAMRPFATGKNYESKAKAIKDFENRTRFFNKIDRKKLRKVV
jgi:hypothetical protein